MAEGGGEIEAVVDPVRQLKGVEIQPSPERNIKGIAAVTNLPSHIPHRMARRAHNMLSNAGFEADVQPVRARGAGPGAGITLWMPGAGFSSLGRKGLPADKVAESAVRDLMDFTKSGKAVDQHLADQLLIPMALAKGRSSYSTNLLTKHTLTNISLLRKIMGVRIKVDGEIDSPGKVAIQGLGISGD